MTSMTDTSDTDRWTPTEAERRLAAELEAAGIRVGAGKLPA